MIILLLLVGVVAALPLLLSVSPGDELFVYFGEQMASVMFLAAKEEEADLDDGGGPHHTPSRISK